jgi:hypothetical protein
MSAPGAPVLLAASDTGKGSPIGLFVVLLLVVAVYLLYRSMTRHIRGLPEKFPGYGATTGTDEAAGPDAAMPVVSPPPGPSDGPEPPRLRPERPA